MILGNRIRGGVNLPSLTAKLPHLEIVTKWDPHLDLENNGLILIVTVVKIVIHFFPPKKQKVRPNQRRTKNASPIVATQIFATFIRERRKGSMHFYHK
jgi:hypothetical protein